MLDKSVIITIIVITVVAILGSDILAKILTLFSSGNGILG